MEAATSRQRQHPPASPEPGAGLDCVGLSVRYGQHVAADDVSFSVGASEVLGLLGPNGAGKTSVIRALTTIIPRSAGEARVGGVRLTDAAAVREIVGVLPESMGYPGYQTAIAYLRYHGQLYGLSADEAARRGRALLETFGLTERADSRIKTFSRGMRQRLGIARALINDPMVVFLDEPTLGLDPAGQAEILFHIRELAYRGRTVVVSSHLLDEVERTCDRVTIMNRGRVVADGDVSGVIRSAGVPSAARLRVPRDEAARVTALLTGSPWVRDIRSSEEQPDVLEITLTEERQGNDVAGAVAASGATLLEFSLRSAQLSDAFLALTRTERGRRWQSSAALLADPGPLGRWRVVATQELRDLWLELAADRSSCSCTACC